MDTSNSPQLIEHLSHSVNYTPFDARWVPCSAKLTVCGSTAKGSGILQLYELDPNNSVNSLKLLSSIETKTGLKCSTFGASLYEQRQLATGNLTGELAVYDIDTLSTNSTPTFSVQAHKGLINSIDGIGGLNIGSGAPELVTGGRDGCVRIWDIRQSTPVAALEPAESTTSRDCWCVSFGNSYNDSNRVVVSGYDNGDIKLFCLRTNKLLWESNVNNGIVGLQFDRKDIEMNKLIVTTLESKFRLYDMRTYHPTKQYSYLTQSAHQSTVWLARHLPQNRDCWLTTGGNGTLNLYKYYYPDQRSRKDPDDNELVGIMGRIELLNSKKFSDQPIVSLDWSNEKLGLTVMTALDQTIKIGIVTKLQTL